MGAMDHVQAAPTHRADPKATAALYSVLVNLLLIGAKLLVGLLTGSVAILADAAHSFLDLSASIFAYAGIRTAAKPADEDHAWGHAKAENISSLIQMFLLGATCIAIAAHVRVAWYSFAVVLAAMAADIVVSRYLGRVSRSQGGSAALEADALHFASDLWASFAVLVGITLVAVFGFSVADPLAGIAVAIIIGTTAIEQGRRTTQVLLDAMPDRPTLRAIERILESDSRLHGYHSLRARQAGKHVMLDVSVHVDGALTLAQAHEVGHAVAQRIRTELPVVSDAVVHVEPVDDEAHG